MAVNLPPPKAQDLQAIAGVRLGVAQAGVRKIGRDDLTVVLLDAGTQVAGVFTQNRFCAAPVQICQNVLAKPHQIRALVINTGNANAGTGADGLVRAQDVCQALANLLDIHTDQVLPFSTGVIMETLPSERIIAALPTAVANAKSSHWLDAAHAIMTTDTIAKAASLQVQLSDGTKVQITGMAKGSGMIHPNMATMLGYIATDACISADLLQHMTRLVADMSFNRISVDGDTSTNDSFIIMATQKAKHTPIEQADSADAQILQTGLTQVAQTLAQAIVRDGEGATKFITITVEQGKNTQECLDVAYAIARSPLVKTAFFASDPNLGRILAAVGYAGITDLDAAQIDMYLGDVLVAQNGGRSPDYQESAAASVMQKDEIAIKVLLHRGEAKSSIWSCDLSYDYVKINADYRS